MSLTKWLAVLLSTSLVATAPAWAEDDDEDEEEVEDEEDEDAEDEDAEDEEGIKPASKGKKSKSADEDEDEDEEGSADEPFKKQNLTGHDTGEKKGNLFEKDRFFVDKVDTEKTEDKTLVQGSLTSTSFGYVETGGTLPAPMGSQAEVPSNSQFSRFFTDLRLQTDFRHISGGKWDARVDVRGRFVNDPGQTTDGYTSPENSDSRVQSGLLGENELEVRELWIIRTGKRADVFFGRQFVPDLAGIKFDGLRVDYASSSRLTYLAFGGLFPLRGSRSITTDYPKLYSQPDPMTGARTAAGRFVGTAGFGAAYRTTNAYGAFGAVTQAPFKAEQPRVFGTATGYLRAGPKLDFYHFAVIDAVGSNAVNAGITNLSLGLNYKPDQRLRAAASFHRVDAETLNVHAQAFLNDPDTSVDVLQNEAYLYRVAQNQARASLSAGLGSMQRFEITTQVALRFRSSVTLETPGTMMTQVTLPAGRSVEVYGAIQDRRSFFNTRIGIDGSRIFSAGKNENVVTYQRATTLALRTFVARELANGRGEWEAEIAYAQTKDDNLGSVCDPMPASVFTCYGAARSSMISLGGSLFYRINRDWFAMAHLYLSRNNLERNEMDVITKDPNVTGISGFARLAYRF